MGGSDGMKGAETARMGRCGGRAKLLSLDARVRGGRSLVILSALALSSQASAQSCPFSPPHTVTQKNAATSCEVLKRSPVLLQPDTALRCQMDQDGNGLDDEIEKQIALCFVPEYRFDLGEPTKDMEGPGGRDVEQSLRTCEPVMGFTAIRLPASSTTPSNLPNLEHEFTIRFKLATLYRHDAGPVYEPSSTGTGLACTNDDHPGDSHSSTLTVRVSKVKNYPWRAELVGFDDCQPPEMSGTHPVLYPSAGKHHQHCSPGIGLYGVGPVSCIDFWLGDGPVRVPTAVFQASRLNIFGPGGAAPNLCQFYVSQGQELNPAPNLQGNNLSNLGFSGQGLLGDFYDASPVSNVMSLGSFTLDADGDGKAEVFPAPGVVPPSAAAAPDNCGLDANATAPDSDQDKLAGKCDPDPIFQQEYVGIGSPAKPPVPPPPSWSSLPVSAQGGFLDEDQDHFAKGYDGCPTINQPNIGISNRWAEDANWTPGPPSFTQLGFYHRGDVCDPQPVTFSKWKEPKERKLNACTPPGSYTVGNNSVGIALSGGRGASINDDHWKTPSFDSKKTWVGNAYRCACVHAVTGAPITGAACVTDPNSACYRNNVREEDPTDINGRGWRPIDRPGCTRKNSWCDKIELPAPRFNVERSGTGWSWFPETQLFGPNTATPHYEPGDVFTLPPTQFATSHESLSHEYAVWSLVELKNHLGLLQKPGTPFPDPEYTPAGAVLQDTTSPESLRVRSALSEVPFSEFRSAHTINKTFSVICPVLNFFELLARVKLWFGPDPVAPWRLALDHTRLVVHDDGLLSHGVIMRPAEQNYASIELLDTPQDTWYLQNQVKVAPLTSSLTITGPGPQLAAQAEPEPDGRDTFAEPDLFVLERGAGGAPPRYARLTAVQAQDLSIAYAVAAEGRLRGALSDSAKLAVDAEGRFVAAVDFAGGVVEAIWPGQSRAMRHQLPAEVLGRGEASIALKGNRLLIAGGSQNGSLSGELWLMDLFSGAYKLLRNDLPSRRGAELRVVPDGSNVLYAGGYDAAGSPHDDVWQLASFAAEPGDFVPKRLYADTTLAPQGLARSALYFDPYANELLRLDFSTAAAGAMEVRTRTPCGWEPFDENGELERCDAGDSLGGRLCELGSNWWSSIGRVPCGQTQCQGGAGVLNHRQKLHPPVVAADVSSSGVWLAEPFRLEHRQALDGQALRVSGSATLADKAIALAARGSRALVATRAGVQLATLSEGGVELSLALPLCGTPVGVEALGESSWAVLTTMGLAIVGGGLDSELRLASMSVLVPSNGGGELIALSGSCQGPKLKKGGALKAFSALAEVAEGKLLVAFGKSLFEVDAANAYQPVLRGSLGLDKALSALRADPEGGRAYGIGQGKYRPVFDWRGSAFAETGTHALDRWVSRRESGELMLRQQGAFAELAWVTP